ncbi:hypothetical protein V1515DRAFT_536864 [Lipomyces mesembrius]
MADVQSRPSHRTSRGGYHSSRGRSSYTSRGSATSSRSNPTSENTFSDPTTMASSASVDDTIQKLKAQYLAGLESLSELFPDWSEEDLLYLLSETAGDVEIAVVRITEGHASQWGEVKKKTKERSKSKGPFASSEYSRSSGSVSTRGRSRGGFESRGRGRGDRGRSRGGNANGRVAHEVTEDSTPSLPTQALDTSNATWGEPATATDFASGGDSIVAWSGEPATATTSSWDTPAAAEIEPPAVTRSNTNGWDSTATATETTNGWGAAPAATAPSEWDKSAASKPVATVAPATTKPTSSVIKPGTKMSWASIAKPVAESKPEPVKSKTAAAPESAPAESSGWGEVHVADASFSNNDFASSASTTEEPDWNMPLPAAPDDFAETTATAPLTHEHVDKVINDAPPPPSSSLASNIDSSSAMSLSNSSSTPAPSKLPPGLSAKNVPTGGRSPAYSRILNQDAPVVMPGSVQAQVERAGLQFGSLNLANAPEEENFETPKEQLEAPVSHKTTPTYQQAPDAQSVDTASLVQPAPSQIPAQGLSGFGQPAIQANRYAQPQQAPIQSQAQQKGFEPFSQSPYGAYPTQTHIPGFGAFPSDYQNPYGADPQRQGYNYYPYQQQAVTTAAAHDSLQRTASSTLEQLTPSSTSTQPTRFGVGSEQSQTSPAPTASPGMSAQHNQYGIHPYYLSPAYTAYYMNNMNNMNSYQGYYGHQQTQPQFGQQKSLYGQQQSQFYGDHYSRAQQLQQQQQQQQVTQQQQPVQQSAQTPQQASVSSLGGIPDFLQQRDDASKAAGGARPASSAGHIPQQQQQPPHQQSQIPPQQQPIPQQQNMYGGFSGYAPYGMGQQGRQGGWGGYGH